MSEVVGLLVVVRRSQQIHDQLSNPRRIEADVERKSVFAAFGRDDR